MKIGVIGLGYVGLPVALAFSRKFEGTIGFDIHEGRIAELRDGIDHTDESTPEELAESPLSYTCAIEDLKDCNFYVIAVPTPVDSNNDPDLTPVRAATRSVAQVLSKGDIVVFESTVYPGVTEDICGPLLEELTGMTCGTDFKLGYSPERINPGDREHTLERIVKVVSGQDSETLDAVAEVYGAIITAGVHRAPSIKVAEAAKVIENTQRDLNIALMNELSIIFDIMNIPTRDVLEAAGTKWNFLKFFPGLVGGHCIGVDPYYLTNAAERLGYHPQVILAGRRINDNMGKLVAQKAIKMLINRDVPIKGARVAVLGITFKENVPDIRNSRVPDIINELKEYGCTPLAHDPYACSKEVQDEYGITLSKKEELTELDAIILAVSHQAYLDEDSEFDFTKMSSSKGLIVDVKACLNRSAIPEHIEYWAL